MPATLVPAFRYLLDVAATRTQFWAFLMAVWFVNNGVVGFAINHDFPLHATHEMYMAPAHMFGFIPVAVNGWHALFHLVTGLAGLSLVRTKAGAVRYAAVTAAVYFAMAALGAFGGMAVCGIIACDVFAGYVHSVEGLILTGIAMRGLRKKDDRIPVERALAEAAEQRRAVV